jgi:hypothetical protein
MAEEHAQQRQKQHRTPAQRLHPETCPVAS